MMWDVVELRRASFSGEIHTVVPKRDQPRFRDSGLDLDEGGRTEGVIEELLRPSPDYLYWFSGQLGQPDRLEGLLIVALPSEGPADIGCDDPHILRRQAEKRSRRVFQSEGRLRGGPQAHLVSFDLRQSRVRFDGGVRDVTVQVRLLEHIVSCISPLAEIPTFSRGLSLRRH